MYPSPQDSRALQTYPLGKPLPQADSGYSAMYQTPRFKQTRTPSAYKIVLDSDDAASYLAGTNTDRWIWNIASFTPQVRGRLIVDRLQISATGTTGYSSMARVRINGLQSHALSYDSTSKSLTNTFAILPLNANAISSLVPSDFTAQQSYPIAPFQLQGANLEINIDQSGYTGGAVGKIGVTKLQIMITIYDDGAGD